MEQRGGEQRPQYSIGTVARRTGVSPHALRAWERRYRVVEPGRSEGGVRLYSNQDIVRLRLLKRLTDAGHAIGRVAGRSTEELVALAREEEQATVAAVVEGRREGDRFVVAGLEAVEAMDGARIQAQLTRAISELRPLEFAEEVAAPLLRRVGEMWAEGQVCSAHEHLLSVCVQRALGTLQGNLPSEGSAPLLLCTTLSGERHELGCLLAAVAAAEAGWRVLYLGPDLPAVDIAQAVQVTGASGVALSVVQAIDAAALRDRLAALRERLPGGVELYLGGGAVAPHREMLTALGAAWFPTLRGLRDALEAGRGRGGEA